MLYVFLVDTGNMIQLDMNTALESVSHLKTVVARTCSIPPDKQVLLISGGENLSDDERVCKYAAGTDTNPIFLFSLVSIENQSSPEIEIGYGDDSELFERIDSSKTLRDNHNTVAIRTSVAQEVLLESTKQTRICENLIHDQHLQHQGWAAAVANLDDIILDLQRIFDRFLTTFNNYLGQREEYKELINSFDEDIAILHKIPVFPALLESETTSMVGSVIPSTPYNGEPINLLQWINSRGSNQSLEQLADSCYRSLQKLDSELLDELSNRVSSAIVAAQNSQMKEIRGLGDRLSALEQCLIFVKAVLQEQTDTAKAFAQNQQRASGLNDASILPDLCASHRCQLEKMKDHHHKIINVRTKFLKAKSELSINLQARMKWVVFVQNQIAEVQQYLVLHYEELKRLQKRMEVLEQIHMAPSMYLATSVEVVRRKAFSRSYLQKSNNLADQFSNVFKEENALRISFNMKLRKHFLSKIFSGMNDLPSEFATNRPEVFDDQLPNVTLADVDMLRKAFPDLAKSLSIPDENALEKLLSKSLHQTLTAEDGETLYSLQSLPKKIHLHGGDLSVSIINKLISGENGVSKKRSVAMERFSDSETDTETERISRRRHSRKKSGDKLTRSLPLENCFEANDINKSTGFSVEANNEEPSSSSAAPSSSSGGNCSSVAPSSSSDGSVMKQGSQHWPSNGDDKSAIIASLTTKVNDSESKIQRLQDDIKNRIAPTRESLVELSNQLNGLKETLLLEKKNFDSELESLSKLLIRGIHCVEKETIRNQESKLSELENLLNSNHEAVSSELQRKLESEQKKLVACQMELESLRRNLDDKVLIVAQLHNQIADERASNQKIQAELKEQFDADKHMAIRTLTLEHELELDGMRQKLAMSERHQKNDNETQKLKEELLLKENDLEALRRKMRLLEVADKERFQAEKDKMVQILEAGFIQREKVSIQSNLEAAEAKHKEDLIKHEKRLQDKYKQHLESSREKLSADWKKKFEDLKSKQSRALEDIKQEQEKSTGNALLQLRQTLEEEKEAALRALSEKLNAKSRREIEGLRQRFRIMQTTGTFERSPSLSESEMTLESPKSGDMTDIASIRSAMAIELENALRAERSKFQIQLQQLHDEHQQEIAELSSKDRLQSTAEQQVKFNEALKKAIDEKEALIVELEAKNKLLAKQIDDLHVTNNGENGVTVNGDRGKLRGIAEQQVVFNEALNKAMSERNVEMERLSKEVDYQKQTIEALNSKLSGLSVNGNVDYHKEISSRDTLINSLRSELQNRSNDGDVVGKLAELTRQNARLETELQEARDLMEKAMTASVVCIPNAPENNQQEIVRFQKENQQLKEQLVKSVNLVKSGKVSITSVERGDNVMVVWNEEHENYIIYTETSNLFHFLHTNSLAPLGLTPSSGPRRLYVTAEVVDKEYCQARRSENRFKVPLGTKFYRIMCKPLVKETPTSKSPSSSLGAAKGYD